MLKERMFFMQNRKKRRFFVVLVMCIFMFTIGTISSFASSDVPAEDIAPIATNTESDTSFTVTYDPEDPESAVDYDLTDGDSALSYVESYADNIEADKENFEAHTNSAIKKVRESIPTYATFWALLAPIIAIVLALITKEVYSSLVIGIVVGGAIYAGGNFETTLNHVVQDGFIASISDSWNVGIILFLILLGAIVAMMNKAGGSAAFGRWAASHIKSRIGAQLATIALGVLIFIDDYFNCLTVGSVMRPVTDENKISRAKLSYLIDATAAPICIIAPISSWAAAVAGFARSAGAESGIKLFIDAIPYNFYAILTIVMMIFLAISGLDFGPMKKHEDNAKEKGDLFTSGTKQAIEELTVNEKGRVIDLVFPIIILIISCVIGMIYTGGFFSGENFVDSFSNSDASVGLALGGFVSVIIIVFYFLIRRVISFKEIMGCVPEGFKAMVPAIMILACAWTLKAMTDSLGAKIFISQLVEGSAGSFQAFLPAIVFVVAVGLSFATGTSWGTFGILIPIVLSIFSADNPLTIVSISACMAGAVCGDHCSPISDTTIMASAGAQCDHLNHVSTQLPYALIVAGVSTVSYIIAGFLPNWFIVLPISLVLMIAALFVVRIITKKKA
jgi:Na+/H+ antiporter NhaC